MKNKGTWEEFNDTGVQPEDYQEKHAISLSDLFDEYINYIYSNVERLFPKERDREIADAVLTIFRNREDLEVFKKKAVYLYVKEITDCKTVHLTKVIKVLKREFYEMIKERREIGLLIDF